MNGRQAAQKTIKIQHSLPIDWECAKFPDFPELEEMNKACDRWLRKRGLIHEHWNRIAYGSKTNPNPNTTNDQEFTL